MTTVDRIGDPTWRVVGVDVGGTFIKAGIVSGEGVLSESVAVSTEAASGAARVLAQSSALIQGLLSKAGSEQWAVQGIGVGVTGQVDFRSGTVVSGIEDKIPGWVGTSVRQFIEEQFHLPTWVDNDGMVAAIGEHIFGAGKGVSNLVCLTIGTGIGSGIILEGKPFRGASGPAGELGHLTINFDGPRCGCGNQGCLEAYVSKSALVNKAMRAIEAGEHSRIAQLVGHKLEEITVETIGTAARQKDSLAQRIITEMSDHLSYGLMNVINVLGPERIVLAGGCAQLGDLFIDRVRKLVRKHTFSQAAQRTEIILSRLGQHAGVIGAGALVLHELHNKHHKE